MTEDTIERFGERIVPPHEILNLFHTKAYEVVQTRTGAYIDGVYQRVGPDGRVVRANDAAPLWHFKVLPYEEDGVKGAQFEAYEVSDLMNDGEVTPYSFVDIQKLCGKGGGFKLVHAPRRSDAPPVGESVKDTRFRSLPGIDQRRKETEASADSLRKILAEQQTLRLDIVTDAEGAPHLSESITNSPLINEMLGAARLASSPSALESPLGKPRSKTPGTFYISKANIMLRGDGIANTVENVSVVPTLVVRVIGPDKILGVNELSPQYLNRQPDIDEHMTPLEVQQMREDAVREFEDDKKAFSALSTLHAQISELQRNGGVLRSNLLKLGYRQVILELEEWRDRSGVFYPVHIPITAVRLSE